MTRKPIPGLDGYYASPLGDVYRIVDDGVFRGRVRQVNEKRVPVVRINGTVYAVADLIALTFIGPRPRMCHVRHIDGNTFDNRISNLQYSGKPLRNRKAGRGGRPSKLAPNAVRWILTTYDKSKGVTQKELADTLGVTQATVSQILNKRTWRDIEVDA